MRITGGTFRNKIIRMRSAKGIRPTSSKVREALFSILGQDLHGRNFLDAFGGSGIMGIEAYSRGANVTICEKRRVAFGGIKNIVEREQFEIALSFGSASKMLRQKWDIIFMDPPYDFDPLPWLMKAATHVQQVLVFEHASSTIMPIDVQNLTKSKSNRYGDSTLSFYTPR